MNSINKIKERLKKIIDSEINRTKKELNIYVQKMIDNMTEKAQTLCEKKISEIMEI